MSIGDHSSPSAALQPARAGARATPLGDQLEDSFPEFFQLFYAVEALRIGRDSLVVQFAGAEGAEGATTAASGFARVAAREYDKPVLFLDCGGRGSSAESRWRWRKREAAPNGPVAAAEPNLTVIQFPDGPAAGARNAEADLRMHLESYRSQYGLVIVDSPPVGRSPRAASLSALCDGTILVVQAERTTSRALKRARANVERLGGQVIGLVFNRARRRLPAWLADRLS